MIGIPQKTKIVGKYFRLITYERSISSPNINPKLMV